MTYNNDYKSTPKKPKAISVTLNDDQKGVVQALLANMVVTDQQVADGVISRVLEQGAYKIKPEMLPVVEMAFERLVLKVLYAIADEHIPATRENLLTRLKLDFKDAEERLASLMNNRTLGANVTTMAFLLDDWVQKQRIVLALEEMVKRAKSPEGLYADLYAESVRMLNSVAPVEKGISHADDLHKLHRDLMDRRLDDFKNGRPAGPTFPWAGLRKKVPTLKIGDMCAIFAKTKHGKSMMGIIMAEWMAHHCKDGEGYDVAYFHMETSPESIADRIVSRNLWVKAGALRVPEVFDHTKEPYKTKYDTAWAQWEHNQRYRGYIDYIHCPGITPSQLKSEVAAAKARADSRGRELVVFIDYYTEIDWTELAREETQGYNALANFLKSDIAESQHVYVIAFAQSNIDTEYGAKKTSWNGSKITMRSQVVIRLERAEAAGNKPLMKNGEQAKDLIGVPIFYHEAGQPHSDSVLNVLFANDDASGPVPVRFINSYFTIQDNPDGPTNVNDISGTVKSQHKAPNQKLDYTPEPSL